MAGTHFVWCGEIVRFFVTFETVTVEPGSCDLN